MFSNVLLEIFNPRMVVDHLNIELGLFKSG
jgi:hypothetical protein